MPHSDPHQRLRHMLDAAEELQGFTAGKTFDDLQHDRGLQHITLHCLMLIGEAASGIESEYRDMHPDIPWRPIIAMRHRLIHGYFDVDLSVVWDTVTLNIPTLLTQLRTLVSSEE